MSLATVSPAQTGSAGGGPVNPDHKAGTVEGRDTGGQALKPFSDMIIAIPDFLLIDLNLTDEQTVQIVSLRGKCLKDIKPLQENAFNRRKDLHQAWSEKAAEQEKISAMQKEIKVTRDRMRNSLARYLQEVKKVLTPEQWSMLRNYWTAWDRGYIVPGN